MGICMGIFVQLLLLSQWGFAGDSEGGDSLACMKKLLPCQPYLKGSLPPAPSCCLPLNRIVADDRDCLCAVFNNMTAILKTFNVTQDDARNLAKTCGAKANITLCEKGAATQSGTPSIPAPPSTSTNRSRRCAPQKASAATVVYHFGGSMLLAAVVSLIVSAF